MRKEFFEEHFHGRSFTNSLNYYLSSLFFNAFPIPQREPGALATLRYIGDLANDKWCLLIFPEGKMTRAGEIAPFQPGVGMIASKLGIPVVPIRIEGMDGFFTKAGRWRGPAASKSHSDPRCTSRATIILRWRGKWKMPSGNFKHSLTVVVRTGASASGSGHGSEQLDLLLRRRLGFARRA